MKIFNLITRIFKRENTPAGSTISNSAYRVGATPLWCSDGMGLSVATVYRCVKLLADSVANLPMEYMRRKGSIFEVDTNHRLHFLLNVEPSPAMSAFDFWRQVIVHVLLRGNAYIVPVYGRLADGIPGIERLALANPDRVSHDTTSDMYMIMDADGCGVNGVFSEREVVHIKGMSRDGKRGLSVLSYARLAVNIATAGDRETNDRFINGGAVRGLVTNSTSVRGFGEYADEELNRTAISIDERLRSGERIISLPGDLQFRQLSLSSTDMQFLESRKFTVREICRFFGVHPSFVFDDTSNNYKSAEMANVAFLSTTLNPLLRSIENELLRKLTPHTLATRRCFRFDRRAIYASDLDSRVRYQTATIAAGIYTVNDWRQQENRPPVKDGDRIFISANLRPIDELSTPTTPSTETNQSSDTNSTDYESTQE